MSGQDSTDVTLANVDPSLLSCWQEMVKRGQECSLLLKHRSDKVIETLQYTTPLTRSSSPSNSSSAKKRKKNKGNKEKRLEALLAPWEEKVQV